MGHWLKRLRQSILVLKLKNLTTIFLVNTAVAFLVAVSQMVISGLSTTVCSKYPNIVIKAKVSTKDMINGI